MGALSIASKGILSKPAEAAPAGSPQGPFVMEVVTPPGAYEMTVEQGS